MKKYPEEKKNDQRKQMEISQLIAKGHSFTCAEMQVYCDKYCSCRPRGGEEC